MYKWNFFKTTEDCGLNKGCFVHPKDCTDKKCLFIYKWADSQDSTNFEITGVVESLDSAWLAIGKLNWFCPNNLF